MSRDWKIGFVQVAQDEPQALCRVLETALDQTAGCKRFQPARGPGLGRVWIGRLEVADKERQRSNRYHQAVTPENRKGGIDAR